MQLSSFFKWSLCLILCSVLFSCADHLPSPVEVIRYRIKKIATSANRSSSLTEYVYDNAGKLANYTLYTGASQLSSVGQTTLYKYDSQGRLISRESQPVTVPGVAYNLIRTIYEYDQSNRVDTIRYYTISYQQTEFVLSNTEILEYNDQQLVNKATVLYGTDPNNPSSTQTTTYTYFDGNIAERAISYTTSINPDRQVSSTFDDRLNPDFTKLEYPGQAISRNNAIDARNQYTYNGAGLLTSIRYNYQEEPRFQALATYEYETY